jgi:hypothetical protein
VLPEAEEALRRSLQRAKIKRWLAVPGVGGFSTPIWSPDGQRVALHAEARDGTALLGVWDSGLTTQIFTATGTM